MPRAEERGALKHPIIEHSAEYIPEGYTVMTTERTCKAA